MSDMSRKWLGRTAQAALVVVAIAFAIHWIRSRVHLGGRDLHVSGLSTPPDSLGPGDLRIYNVDSTLDLVLLGNKIAAGLSPKMVQSIRTKMDSSSVADTGLGGSIAALVKHTVAGAIGTHAEFPLADVRDVRFSGGRLIFDWNSGSQHTLFDNTSIDGKRASDTFLEADAKRFIDAVHARQEQLKRN